MKNKPVFPLWTAPVLLPGSLTLPAGGGPDHGRGFGNNNGIGHGRGGF